MGEIYRATHVTEGVDVAIKVPATTLRTDEVNLRRFARAANLWLNLDHPNLARVRDFDTNADVPYIALEPLPASRLTDTQFPTPANLIIPILRPIASALDYMHTQGIIHRNIKGFSIEFDEVGTPFLGGIDFLAKDLNAEIEITQTGHILGTPNYMPPEQWRSEEVGPATDQYALGIMAYELLTGKAPFEAPNSYGVMGKHLNDDPPLEPLPPPLRPVIQKVLAKAPEDRYPTVTAFVDALEQAIESIEAPSPGRPMAKLTWTNPKTNETEEYILYEGATATIGRLAANDICIPEQHVSRDHAVISWDGQWNGFVIKDMSTANGTYVNDREIREPTLLVHNDEIRLYVPTLHFSNLLSEHIASVTGSIDGRPITAVERGTLITAVANTSKGKLIITTGPQEGNTIPLLLETLMVGRATSTADWEIALQDPSVSRPHARLDLIDWQWHVTDLGSANGTLVNNKPISDKPHPLKDGDIVAFGATMALFRTSGAVEPQVIAQPAELMITSGGREGTVISLEPAPGTVMRIGPEQRRGLFGRREEWEISLPDRTLSRPHAELSYAGEWYIKNLDPASETYVNNSRMESAMPILLEDGVMIQCGATSMLFRTAESEGNNAISVIIPDQQPVKDTVLAPGDSFAQYQIIQHIGAGGTGSVYLARRQTDESELVALKVFRSSLNGDFIDWEIDTMRRLEHIDGVMEVLDDGAHDGRRFYAMPYYNGGTLLDLLDTAPDKRLTVEEAADILEGLCAILEDVHNAGAVHNDIKPGNVMLANQRQPILADFITADNINVSQSPLHNTNLTNSILGGTPAYMSPEAWQNDVHNEPARDQFAVGVMTFQMLMGEMPFATTGMAIVYEIVNNDYRVQERMVEAGLPAEVGAVVATSMEKDPADRYPSVSAFYEAFAAAIPDKEPAPDPTTRPGLEVFIAYHRSDEAFARQITERLEDAGYRPWIDMNNLRGGGDRAAQIDDAMRSADAMLLVMSPDAVESPVVQNEWGY
ncbi:MAG: FHA domain-containing protein, partial [Chloroflexota bacterium]